MNPDRKRQQLARRIVQRQQAESTTSADPVMESLDHMREQVRELRDRAPDDPHGFHDMSERDLVNWMGAGNAQPGSVVFKHAELVLSMKQREAGAGSAEQAPADATFTSVHGVILTLTLGVCVAGRTAAHAIWPVTVGATLLAFIGLAVGPSQRAIARLLDRLGRIGS